MKLFSLEGKNALITGGYGHLGKAVAKSLSEAGAKTYVLGRDKNKFDKEFAGSSVIFKEFDLANTEKIKSVFKEINLADGKIDILINNAFYLKGNKPDALSDEDFAYSLDGTLASVYRSIREVIPYMKKQNYGRIINVSSMYGMVSPDFGIYKNDEFLNPPQYGAAKAGVIQLTKYFAGYLGENGITVNCISPGPFPSPSVQEHQDFIERLNNKTMLKRIGVPEELSGAFVFFASNASSYITGQNLAIDGGWTAW